MQFQIHFLVTLITFPGLNSHLGERLPCCSTRLRSADLECDLRDRSLLPGDQVSNVDQKMIEPIDLRYSEVLFLLFLFCFVFIGVKSELVECATISSSHYWSVGFWVSFYSNEFQGLTIPKN